MRVVRWSGPPAVVRVETPEDVVVAVPCGLPRHDILGLARLVLSGREYTELRRTIGSASSAEAGGASRRSATRRNRESRKSDNYRLKPALSRRHGLSLG